VQDQLGAITNKNWCLKSQGSRNSFSPKAPNPIVGRFSSEERGADLVHVELVLAGRVAGVEPAPVLVDDHV
jgi:hypothetical protein